MTTQPHIALDLFGAKEEFFFSGESLSLDSRRIPRHVAIMMDGNRRWAKRRGLPAIMGHWEGSETLTDIVRAASRFGIKTLTVYAFSTENWLRPKEEIDALLNLFEVCLVRKRESMVKDGVRLETIGDLSRLPKNLQQTLEASKRATEKGEKINLVLAINYGARDEIRRALAKLLEQSEKGALRSEELTEELIAQNLDTTPWGDPDLLIRTSGELRLSNFLLWQISYAEIYVTEVLWPDFSAKELLEALLAYQQRTRRLGGGSC